MNQSLLVLSPSRIGGGIPNESLHQAREWKKSLTDIDTEIVLELPIHRAGQDGWVPDNPPIEEIDTLIHHARECHCRFGSLRLPIQAPNPLPNHPEKNLGQEISAINGWADLASYADITLARLSVLSIDTLATSPNPEFFTNIIDYMSEMEVTVSIGSPDPSQTTLPDFFDALFLDPDRHCGLDLRLPLQVVKNLESLETFLDNARDAAPITVSLSLPGPFDPKTIQSIQERILAQFGDELQAVVFELE